jgi:urea transporter
MTPFASVIFRNYVLVKPLACEEVKNQHLPVITYGFVVVGLWLVVAARRRRALQNFRPACLPGGLVMAKP